MTVFWRLLYECFAKRLPASGYPILGKTFNAVRVACVRRFVAHCGESLQIGPHVVLSRTSVIGNRVTINDNCSLQGCEIGDDALIAPWCYVVTRNHRFDNLEIPISAQGYGEERPPTIGRGVWIGARVMLLPAVLVGDGAIVAAGAVVSRDVPPRAIVTGPAAHAHRLAPSQPPAGFEDLNMVELGTEDERHERKANIWSGEAPRPNRRSLLLAE